MDRADYSRNCWWESKEIKTTRLVLVNSAGEDIVLDWDTLEALIETSP